MRIFFPAAALFLATPAISHVTVSPKESAQGAHEKYAIRVPNEKAVDTIAVEARFPAGLNVRSVEQKPEWRTEPRRDAAGNLTGVRWTGKLAPGQFTEFGLLAVNPKGSGELVWTTVQTYADGTTLEWSGERGSKTPAPRVTLTPAR